MITSRVDPESFIAKFKYMNRDAKVAEAQKLIQWLNEHVDEHAQRKIAEAELKRKIDQQAMELAGVKSSIDTINAILRKCGHQDRIKGIANLGSAVANLLWKLNVPTSRTVP